MCSIGIIKNKPQENVAFIGELSLDGKINRVNGVLPMCIEAKKLGIKKVIVPTENAKEAAIVKDIEIIGVSNLKQVVKYLNKEIEIKKCEIDIDQIFKQNENNLLDFSEVKGQENNYRLRG